MSEITLRITYRSIDNTVIFNDINPLEKGRLLGMLAKLPGRPAVQVDEGPLTSVEFWSSNTVEINKTLDILGSRFGVPIQRL